MQQQKQHHENYEGNLMVRTDPGLFVRGGNYVHVANGNTIVRIDQENTNCDIRILIYCGDHLIQLDTYDKDGFKVRELDYQTEEGKFATALLFDKLNPNNEDKIGALVDGGTYLLDGTALAARHDKVTGKWDFLEVNGNEHLFLCPPGYQLHQHVYSISEDRYTGQTVPTGRWVDQLVFVGVGQQLASGQPLANNGIHKYATEDEINRRLAGIPEKSGRPALVHNGVYRLNGKDYTAYDWGESYGFTLFDSEGDEAFDVNDKGELLPYIFSQVVRVEKEVYSTPVGKLADLEFLRVRTEDIHF